MKVLVISDVHSNVWALREVLRAEQGFDLLVCAGDYVDYGIAPKETIALARGGTLTHDNSGPAHRWCNAIKGTHSLAWARERVAQLIAQGKAPQRIAPVSAGPIRCSDWFGGGE